MPEADRIKTSDLGVPFQSTFYRDPDSGETRRPEMPLTAQQAAMYGGYAGDPAYQQFIDQNAVGGSLSPDAYKSLVGMADAKSEPVWQAPVALATAAIGGGLAAGLGGAAGAAGAEAAGAAGAGAGAAAGSELFAPVATGLGEWSVGTDALLGMTAEEAAAISGAFPATSGAAGGSMLMNPGYNVLDPSTYGGSPGSSGGLPNIPPGTGTAAQKLLEGGDGDAGPSYIPAINTMGSLGPSAAQFGISAPQVAAGSPAFPGFNALDPSTYSGATGGGGSLADPSLTEDVMDKIKKGGGTAMDWIMKNPASAGMLGISAVNALSKPKLPDAARAVQGANTPNLAAASGVINAGGASGPAWNTQKASIDAQIDRQIAQRKQQILQQAQNSGTGVDSLVTVQQIQQMTEQMEGVRQQQYMQAQGQNVQAALSQLGMSNQALGQVAQQEFASSKEAQSSAAQTAQLALMLQQMQKPTANQQATPAS